MSRNYRNFTKFKEDVTALLEEESPQGVEQQIYLDMLMNVAQLKAEKLDVAELRLMNTAFKELRYALKIFKPYRSIPKAAIFGSARTPKAHPNFQFAREFGKKLAKKGWMVITGAASGIMEAAMEGAGADHSFGLNILLPFEQEANPVIRGNQKLVYFKYFFTRKLMFLKESEATVLFPGGFGTFDEGFESFTLVQTGKAKPRPIVLVDPPQSAFWRSALNLFKKNMEGEGLISRTDLSLMGHFQNTDQAVQEITQFYRNYHSSRFFRDQYLIRLRKKISGEALVSLGREFKDILAREGFERFHDIQEDDIRDPSLERIVFYFDRAGYSRLRQLINRLNSL